MAENTTELQKDLDDLETFEKAVGVKDPGYFRNVGTLYCPKCGDGRRMDMVVHFRADKFSQKPPILTLLQCVQCDTRFTATVYQAASGKRGLAMFPNTDGGLTTPHTPNGVSYYLDQGQKAQSVGANSAAVAMFRGALDQLLFEQGFKVGTCGTKLNDLNKAIADKTAPKWAYDLDVEFLKVMKELGDGSIHPNDGDVTKQARLDGDLLAKLIHTFHMLLFLVYELPFEKQERLRALKAGVIKK